MGQQVTKAATPQVVLLNVTAEAHARGLRGEKVTQEDVERWLDELHCATTVLAVEAFAAGHEHASSAEEGSGND